MNNTSILVETSKVTLKEKRSIAGTYAELKKRAIQHGLLEKQQSYYIYRIALLMSLLAIGIVFLLVVNNFWLQLLNACYFGFLFTQLGLLGHEAGHHQMFRRSWKHNVLSLIGGNLLLGMSYTWWNDKHNAHHSHPNQLEEDPDLDIVMLELTGHADLSQMSKVRQWVVKHQVWFFFPGLMTVLYGLQDSSIRFLLKNKTKYRTAEWILLALHYIAYVGGLLFLFPWWQALIFALVNYAVAGLYLGSIFAPNHKGMTILEQESNMDFLLRQIVTARNIHGHPITDFMYGGLNYQIEHHLFPTMPRNQLKKAQVLVKQFCQEYGISYYETSVAGSFSDIMQFVHEVGAPLRNVKA